ncbi:MAG: hypothetical protein HFF70_02450 [Oscillospiraceae bacterium]|nr:hypothetical protein [Oscillospiraceae bacterium]
MVQNVYASPDLPEIHIELIDMDELENESEETRSHKKHLLDTITQTHKHIF